MIRFDCNEECRCLCIDYIFDFYNLEYDTTDNIKKITGVLETMNYLENKGFIINGYIDKRLLINFKYLWLTIFNKFTVSQRKFDLKSDNKEIILYYTSAYELYEIDEPWTHCICESFINSKRDIYDSYIKEIRRSIPNFVYPTHSQILNKLIIALKIRRN